MNSTMIKKTIQVFDFTEHRCEMLQKARLKEMHRTVNVGGRSSVGGVDAGWLPRFLHLAGKLRAAQIPVDILTSGLEVMWQHKCPLLAHSYVCNPPHLWINATVDGKIPMGNTAQEFTLVLQAICLHGDTATWCPTWLWERRGTPAVQTHKWSLGDWVKAAPRTCWMVLGRILRALTSASLCRYRHQHKAALACCWITEFHTDADDEMQCKKAAKGNPNSFEASVSAL